MDREDRPPAFIRDGYWVDWKIKPQAASSCHNLEYDWCRRLKKTCCYKDCPIRIDGSMKTGTR